MKQKTAKILSTIVALALAMLFVGRFAGGTFLQLYVKTGIGDCQSIPILCMTPTIYEANPRSDTSFIDGAIPYNSDNLSAYVPKGFTVVEEIISKPYYKKYKHKDKGNIIYLFRKDAGFFTGLYPQLKSAGVNDDYEFIKRVMYARVSEIKNITDTFFVIMKGIFIPDLGNQLDVKMVSLQMRGINGFVNYNLGKNENYFDCDIIGKDGSFYKVYIKDRDKQLDMEKVIAIISSLRAKS